MEARSVSQRQVGHKVCSDEREPVIVVEFQFYFLLLFCLPATVNFERTSKTVKVLMLLSKCSLKLGLKLLSRRPLTSTLAGS